MRTEIYIENNPLDLYDDIDTTFTFAIDDVKDFGSRNTSYSKTITIPGNSVNNKAFGHVFEIGSANFYDSTLDNFGYNFNPMVSTRCLIFVDKIQIFKGSLRILQINNTDGVIEYECFVFGELGGLMFEIGNARLQDLDFSAYDLVYSSANIQASWDAINGSGVYFPLIDYGNVSTNKVDFNYRAFRPALYVREYIEKIFAGTSYTLDMPVLESGSLDSLIIPHNSKTLQRSTTNIFIGSKSAYQLVISYGTSNTDRLSFPSFTSSVFTDDGSHKKFTYSGTDPVSFTLNFSVFNGSYKANMNYITGRILKNGVAIATKVFGNTGGMTISVYWTESISVSLVHGDYIEIDFTVSDATHDFSLSVTDATMSFDTTVPTLVPIVLGDTITVNDAIPKGIFQKDFLLSIFKMFNCYVYENPFDDKKIIVTPYVQFYPTTTANALNWTDKVDRSQTMSIVPMSELNARFYQYKFKEDNDFYNEDYRKGFNQGYGDRLYDTTFEFSKDTAVLDVIFANSVLYQNAGTDKIYPAIYKLSGTTETAMDHVIRIMYAKKIPVVDSWHLKDDPSTIDTLTKYGYAGHLDDPFTPTQDICFGAPQALYFTLSGAYPTANIFNSLHSAYISEITDKDSKLVKLTARLTTLDIQQLDFSKFIYVDGVLFRLNKIDNYNPINEGLCQIELLRVIDY